MSCIVNERAEFLAGGIFLCVEFSQNCHFLRWKFIQLEIYQDKTLLLAFIFTVFWVKATLKRTLFS